MTMHPAPATVPRGVKIGTQSCTEFFPFGSEAKLQGVLGSHEQESVLPAAPGLLPPRSTGSVLPWTFTGQRPLSGAPFSQHAMFRLGKPGNPLPPPTHIRFCSNLLCPGFGAHPLLVSVRAWLGMCVSSFCTHLTLAVNTSLVPAGSRPIGRSHSRKTRG